MSTLNVYLVFEGNCSEAMNFYKDCLGGEVEGMTVKDSPMADQWPEAMQDHVLHCALMSGNMVLYASDMALPQGNVEGNKVLLTLNCDSAGEMDRFFESLSAGGERTKEPHDFFAGKMAVLTDKFGKTWMLHAPLEK